MVNQDDSYVLCSCSPKERGKKYTYCDDGIISSWVPYTHEFFLLEEKGTNIYDE